MCFIGSVLGQLGLFDEAFTTSVDEKQLTLQKLDAVTQLHSFYEQLDILVDSETTDDKPKLHGPSLLAKKEDVQRVLVLGKKLQSIVEIGTKKADKEHSQKFTDWIKSPETAERFKAMSQYTKAVKKEVSQACSDILVKTTNELSELAGCDRGGKSWKADLSADSRLVDVVHLAAPALQGAVAVELNAAFNKIQKEHLQMHNKYTKYHILTVFRN
eukprot:6492280-Amphidinium_carterae.2